MPLIDLNGLGHFKDRENAMIAEDFAATKDYAAGDYCYYNGTLKKFKTAHAAGAWIGTDAEDAKLAGDVSSLKESISDIDESINDVNIVTVKQNAYFTDSLTNLGLTYEKISDNKLKIYGTSTNTGGRYLNILNGNSATITSIVNPEKPFKAGKTKISYTFEGYASSTPYYLTGAPNKGLGIIQNGKETYIDKQFAVVIYVGANKNFGTSDNPTYITISVEQEYIDNYVDYSYCFEDGFIALNGTTADITDIRFPTSPDYAEHCVVSCSEGEKFRICTFGQVSPRSWGVLDENSNIIYVADAISGVTHNTLLSPVDIVIPSGGKTLIANHYVYHGVNYGYSPKVIKITNSNLYNEFLEAKHTIPTIIKPEWKRCVVASYKKMLVINENGVLKISKNCGISFSKGIDVTSVGLIKSYHLYANGCLGFFTHTKAYYTEDFTTFSEATCYEADGTTIYTPATYENFYVLFDNEERKFIGNQDMYVFGNYIVNGANTTPPTRVLIWYSIDNGHSYKIAYEFNKDDTIAARHVHNIVYYESDDTFICCTGDTNETQCWVLACKYDTSNDTWTITALNQTSSRVYKWADVAIWGNELYFSYDNTPGKVMKCKYSEIGDSSKFEDVLTDTEADAIAVKIGKNGDMVVSLSHSRSTAGSNPNLPTPAEIACKTIYYSSDRKTFNKIILDSQIADSYTVPSGFIPITEDGHIICGVHGAGGTIDYGKLPSIYLDDYIRLAGFNDAFSVN